MEFTFDKETITATLKVAKGLNHVAWLNTYGFVIYDHSSLAAEGYRYCGLLGPPGGPAGLKCMEAVVVVAKQQNGE